MANPVATGAKSLLENVIAKKAEQYGAELPMDTASRLSRAAEQGYDTTKTYYHGTQSNIDEFYTSDTGLHGEGVYLTDSPDEAAKYAMQNRTNLKDAGPNIIPVHIKGKLFDATTKEGKKWRSKILSDDIPDELRNMGYSGIKTEDGINIFDPMDIRSIRAKFDPKEEYSANILASVGATAAIGGTTVLSQEANAQEKDQLAEQISGALNAGYSIEDVTTYLTKSMKGQMTEADIAKKVNYIANPNATGADTPDEKQAMDLADKYHNIYDKYSDMAKSASLIISDNPEMRHNLNKDRRELNQFIADELKNKHNLNTFVDQESGDLVMQTPDGKIQPVDSSILNSIGNSMFEVGGAIAGAASGAKLAAAAAPPVLPYVGTLAKPIAGAVGGLVGGAVGAFSGRGIDLLRNAFSLKENLDSGFILSQMTQSGAADIVMSVAGAGAFKLGSATIKGTGKAWNLMTKGNVNGAFQALTETIGISRNEAKQIVADWEKLNQREAPGATIEEKAIGIAAQTQPKAEGITRAAISEDPQASARLVQSIDNRAKGLHEAINRAGPNDVATTLVDGLNAYSKDVKDFYGLVKQEAVDTVDHTDYRFNYDKLAIEPVLSRIGATLDNPQLKERFLGMMTKIGSLSETRTFSDLIELRQTVNQFKYNTKITRYSDKVALDSTLNKLDSEIGKVAKEYMPENGKPWLKNFAKAKEEYAKMSQLEDNALVKVLNRPGVTEDEITKVLPKYMNSIDNTFNEVLDKLSPKVREKTETAAIKHLSDKFTQGAETDLQAVNFPLLQSEVNKLPLKTAQAKALANSIGEMAKVFKNDPSLAKLGGQFYVREGGSTLTTDLTAKAKYAVASTVWRHMVKLLPTQYGRNSALITQTARLLDNPLNSKTVADLMKNFKGQDAQEVNSLVKNLQVQYTKQGAQQSDKLKLYKVGSGSLTKSSGAMGNGVYMTERVENPRVTEHGKQIVKYEVNRSQLADINTISKLVGKDVTVADLRKMPEVQQKLSDNGFVGISHQGKVMLFDDSIVEHGITRKQAKVWSDPQM